MPRSSRSKSHRQSKHSSKDTAAAREYSASDEDVKMKERSSNGGKEDGVSIRIGKDSSVSGERRRHGKDLSSSHGNGDVTEEYTTSSKRREEKSHGGGGSDRWNGGSSEEKGVVVNIENKDLLKSKDFLKVVGESKSKSSRRHDVESANAMVTEKDESKSGSGNRGEKRKSEKESGRKENSQYKEIKESKDKDRGSDRGRKVHPDKLEAEASSKQPENQTSKRGKEISEWPIEEELRNPELEKELEKRMRRRGEGSSDKDKYQDGVKEGDDRRLSTRSDRSKDERHKDEGYGDMYREDGVRETRQREDKYREDGERDRKNRDVKHRGESERHNKHRDDKYREDGERDRHREDKYYEDGNRDNKHKDDKYHEDGDRDGKHRDEKYMEIGDRDERSRDGKRKQDDDRDSRHKEEKHREDVDRDHRHRDVRHRDDTDREKRARDSKYRDLHTSRDHPIEPEAKRLRDDSITADLYHRKTNNRDGSPIYDDRIARYKDDKDRRRGNDKDEPSDYRSRSMKEQRSESEKRSSAKVDSVSERGRLGSRYGDMEITASHSRRRSSPGGSSYPARDHHRVSKQEEAKYRDYAYEERTRHSVHSSRDFPSAPGQSDKLSSRSLEKVAPKDDNYVGDLSVDRRLRPDSRSSPQVDKSPSSTSNERKNLSRSDVRRSLDLEEPGQRSGGSKDAKEHMVKDSKGSRELVMEAHPDNDFSQVDGDNLSVSSPYTRSSHFSGNSKSLLPPPSPFRTGSDSPFFGSTEDDRSKSNNRHRRMGDPNMGRAQGNWKNVPNWPSPLATGGYIPFQHVPPPMFHPLMQQFPPPMFGRPPMKLNPSLPYHVPDHGRPLAWRNQGDESVPPPLHGWDANNAVFGDESHLYGRLDWDRRAQLSNRGWEPSADMWKGQNAGASMDVQSGPQKDGYSAHRPTDEIWSGQMGQHVENEQNQPDIQDMTMNGSQSSNALEGNLPEAQKLTESPQIFQAAKEDSTTLISQVYLSRVDVSEDLTQPELYEQCTNMMDLDQEALSDEIDCKILFLEEGVEANVTDGASLFAAINDSVFQKALSLYKKQKEEFHSMNGEKISCPITNGPEFVLPSDQEKGGSDNDGKPVQEEAAEGTVLEVRKEKDELPIRKLDTDPVIEANVVDEPKKSEEPMDMEVDDAVVKQEEEAELTTEISSAVEECPAPSAGDLLSCKVEEASESTNDEKNKLVDTNCGDDGGGLLSDVSTTAVAVMPTESIEFGSVNLSRIHHHSPESTH